MTLGNNQKLFWVVMVVAVVLSTATIFLTSPTLTGGVAIQTIAFMQEGKELHFEVKNVENVKEANIQILKDTKNAKIIFEDITPPEFNGKIISAFRGTSDIEDNFGQIKFLLKIKESDLRTIEQNALKLYRNGEELVTIPGKKERGYIEYSATSPGLGLFVIGLKNPSLKIEDKTATPTTVTPEPVFQKPAPVKRGFFGRIADFFRKFLG
jgi:ABC-type Na+ efflux pump permease subunit